MCMYVCTPQRHPVDFTYVELHRDPSINQRSGMRHNYDLYGHVNTHSTDILLYYTILLYNSIKMILLYMYSICICIYHLVSY